MTGRGRLRRLLALAAPAVLVAATYLLFRHAAPVAVVEAETLDWRYALRGPRSTDAPVTVLAIDDATLQAEGGWPLSRSVLARAVDRLDALGAGVIALDLLMERRARTAGGDARLAAALQRAGNVALPVSLVFRDGAMADDEPALLRPSMALLRGPGAPELPRAKAALAPLPALLDAAAGIGHVNVLLDADDDELRQLYPALTLNDRVLPALPAEALRLYRGLPADAMDLRLPGGLRLGPARFPVDPDGRWTLNYYGPGSSLRQASLARLLDGSLPPEAVAGRIVWVGATATAVGDTFATPFDAALPGVEAFATATANLIDGSLLRRDETTALLDLAAILLLGALGAAIARIRATVLALALVPLPAVAWFGVAAYAFAAANLWLHVVFPVLAALVGAGAPLTLRGVIGERQRRRLAAYVPPRLADALADADRPEFEGRSQTATVLFVDLAGFTERSEALGPAETVKLLRRLHADFEDLAARHDGYVDSFAGDGAMLVFGVPHPCERDAANALACARDLLQRGRVHETPLRIGLHQGEVQVAQLGGPRHRQLTVAGDAVNLASRLMEVAKHKGAALALSDAVAAAAREAGDAALLSGLSFAPGESIRGRKAPVDVWVGAADADPRAHEESSSV